ncbi:hypothetical protein CTI12_AA510090 [Artemisia annua]|uniref:Uncharacterized protein n=1 Tax=Artemisia annua TaxID=35608 RepID=A0A2U1LBB7_ARTAN|nr:hypothetical protein CTI12_AA510090 [Artemisia annua]
MGNYVSCTLTKYSKSTKVIYPNGEIRKVRQPIKAAELMLESPNMFLVNSKTLKIGARFQALNADEDLEIRNILTINIHPAPWALRGSKIWSSQIHLLEVVSPPNGKCTKQSTSDPQSCIVSEKVAEDVSSIKFLKESAKPQEAMGQKHVVYGHIDLFMLDHIS